MEWLLLLVSDGLVTSSDLDVGTKGPVCERQRGRDGGEELGAARTCWRRCSSVGGTN